MCERGSWVFRRWIHVARHLLDNLTTTLPLSTLLPSPFYTVALRDDTRAETPRGFFFFSLLFFFLFFLYFSLYRQIRATEYEYIIRVTSGTRTMQLGKGGRRDSYRSIQKNYSNFRHALLKFLHQFRDVRFVRTASANMTAIFES